MGVQWFAYNTQAASGGGFSARLIFVSLRQFYNGFSLPFVIHVYNHSAYFRPGVALVWT